MSFVKTTDDSSGVATLATINAALIPYSTTSVVGNTITSALQPYSTTTVAGTVTTNALLPYSTTTVAGTATANALLPYSTTTVVGTSISNAVAGVVSANNTWIGTNAFNTSLPTSTVAPTTSTQFVTKSYVDGSLILYTPTTSLSSTYDIISARSTAINGVFTSNNVWTGTNALNTALPTSTQLPSADTQLSTKIYVDTATSQLKTGIVGNFNNAFGTDNCFNTIKTSTGIVNLALGNSVMQSITSGGANVAVGQGILGAATTTAFDTGVGTDILSNITTITSHRNVGVGASALSVLTSGAYNTAIGTTVLSTLVTGSENVGIGRSAGQYTKGSYNTLLGSGTGQVSGDTNQWNYSTALGYGAINTASNQIVVGRTSETVIITGVLRAAQEADPVTAITTFSTTPTFDMNANGMVYSMTPTAAMTSAIFSNIPTTPASAYSFIFVLKTASAYYINSSTISVVAGGITYTATLVGLSNVVLPTTYTYLTQTITIVATGTVVVPTFIALTSVSGY